MCNLQSATKRFGVMAVAVAGISSLAFAADPPLEGFLPGNLVVSRSVYTGTAATVTVGQALPPNCPATAACSKPATNDGTYPNVFLNAAADGSFGVTSPIFLDRSRRKARTSTRCRCRPASW